MLVVLLSRSTKHVMLYINYKVVLHLFPFVQTN